MLAAIMSYSRCFQIWSYTVGHGRLLLRSTKSEEHPTTVDVLFKNVKLICLPTLLNNLEIVKSDDISSIQEIITTEMLKNRTVFRISGMDYQGYVVAGVVDSHEDERDYNDPSALLE